ncbi:MAG: adenosylcobinamide-GDP ribazoletransferase [Kiritimatiellae bacterium]|nr:adenosylcobinamide-GDP ribazoletransferase [Kiritimatiellia bacterium]MDD5521398.1 adenosylcobinamide-GDP ribazoletransferase [Kiritimatiellia bacterium]
MRGLITAIRTLTLFPVPGRDAEEMSDSLPFFPLVGALIGLLVTGIAWIAGGRCGWPIGAAVLCVGVVSFLTGGLHLDGLADTFDSLGGQTIQRRLEIMKDSRIGSYGVIVLILVLSAKIAAIARLAGVGNYWQLIVPFVVSRVMQVHLIVTLPYARAEGGMGQKFVKGATMYHFVVAYIVGLMLCFAVGSFFAVIIGIGACLLCSILASWMRRTFGGVTGDLIGMGSELFETGIMVILGFSV